MTRWLTFGLFLAAVTPSLAQTPSTAAAPGDVSFAVRYEVHRDHLHYGFENPSSVDTPFLVPHRFDQTYVADNQWVVFLAHYPLFGDAMDTEFGLTPRRATFGSDLDTFYDPSGDVIVSGTAGDVTMHGLRFAQWSGTTLWGLPWRVGYVYRRDTTDFHSSARIVTHSMPASESMTPINTHETTISQVQEIPVGVSKTVALAPRWRLAGGADFSPVAIAKLTTILPEKYPGQDIDFSAKIATFAARLDLAWRRERWRVTLSLGYGRTWSYRSSNVFDRDALQGSVQLGLP